MEKIFISNNLKSIAIHFAITMVAGFLYAGSWNTNGKTFSYSIFINILCAVLYIVGGMLFVEKGILNRTLREVYLKDEKRSARKQREVKRTVRMSQILNQDTPKQGTIGVLCMLW